EVDLRGASALLNVRKTTHHQVIALRDMKKKWNEKSENAGAEVRFAMERAVAADVLHPQTLTTRCAVPSRANVVRGKNFPAVLIGDDQGQAAIRKAATGIVNP